MAASSSNRGFIVQIGEEYPSPSHVYTPILVTVKLSGKDRYNAWKTQILCLLTSHNMLGFINGKVERPKVNVHRQEAWMRSDSIVKGWILGTLSEEVTMKVLNRLTTKNPNLDFTAKDVWEELERTYDREIIQKTIASNYSSVVKEIRKRYPCPSHVHAPDHVMANLSGKIGYNAWKMQMTQLLASHDMLGFIYGKVERHTENSTRKVGGLKAWSRSDELVTSWILGSLSYEATMYVFDSLACKIPNTDFSAKDVWDELERIYGPETLQQAIAAGETELITENDATSEGKSEEEDDEEEEMTCPSRFEWKYMRLMHKTKAEKKLYECIVKQDTNLVNDVLKRGGVTVTDKITENGDTALHVAVGTSKGLNFFKKLLKKTPKDVPLTDLKNSHGSTLLHIAVTVGNIEAAEILMDRYPDMLQETDNEGQTPLVVALSNMHSKVYWDLLDLIKKKPSIRKDTLFTDKLLELAISSKEFYLARNLIWWWCNKLDSDAVLMAMAQNYPCELSFWERRIAALPFVKRILQKHHKALEKLKSVKRVEKRHEAFQVLKSVCENIKEYSSDHKKYYTKPVLEATRLNALEVVKVLVYHFPDAFWSASEDGHNVIQYAVINRSEKIYNLLYHMSEHKNVYKTIKDASMNNLLHLAARLAPSEKLDSMSGAALKIQYELQWYKEVEAFVCSLNITQKNSFEETPRMVFTREHKELLAEGEKWMKSTAESYTVIAALIATIMFAAAITVPGGNNQETGVPIFTNNLAFTIFAVSDAISLFTAVMSLLMFLSIIIARFAEEDFLHDLPRKLIIGFITLFISTTTMFIAFGAALFIVFGQNNGSLLIPIGALTGLTVTFFVALQFPLVVDLMRATYGRSIFGRRNTTFKTCLQNFIQKMTWQPIVDDKKKEREIVMNNDRRLDYHFVHSADDIPFTI